MNTISIPCNCGMKGCTTSITIGEDDLVTSNLLFKIDDEKHELPSFVSVDKEMAKAIVNALRKKFKGL